VSWNCPVLEGLRRLPAIRRCMYGVTFRTVSPRWRNTSRARSLRAPPAHLRNERSRKALERIGAQFEGVLRAHRLASDLTPRDSVRYSIVAAEWPGVKARLCAWLQPA
jgi:hypothetical protein